MTINIICLAHARPPSHLQQVRAICAPISNGDFMQCPRYGRRFSQRLAQYQLQFGRGGRAAFQYQQDAAICRDNVFNFSEISGNKHHIARQGGVFRHHPQPALTHPTPRWNDSLLTGLWLYPRVEALSGVLHDATNRVCSNTRCH